MAMALLDPRDAQEWASVCIPHAGTTAITIPTISISIPDIRTMPSEMSSAAVI